MLRGDAGPYNAPRTVKPMIPDHTHYPVVAIDHLQEYGAMEDGEIVSVEWLGWKLHTLPSSIFVCIRGGDLLGKFDRMHLGDPLWQFKVSPMRADTEKRPIRNVMVNFFGWKAAGGRVGQAPSHWHYMLDPTIYASFQILEGDTIADLLRWGCDVRSWAVELGIKPKPTAGGLAKQLLRHPLFYTDPRRKVPFLTNDTARPHMPGNHYRRYMGEREVIDAMEIDMTSAHHWAASTIDLPHADSLRARGHFKDIPNVFLPNTYSEGRPWRERHNPSLSELLDTHGLLLVRLQVPRKLKFAPPYMEVPGRHMAWVYTNELDMIRRLGGIIDGIDAAWTSTKVDYGIRKFAAWSLEQLKDMPLSRKRWCKSTLLAAYGALAGQRRPLESGLRQGKGKVTEWPTGSSSLSVIANTTKGSMEPPIANVIQRGMIEAEIRRESIETAIWLDGLGHRVLAIYVDALFVAGGTLPLLPPPWRVAGPRTRLMFVADNAYRSLEQERLPGVPREARERITRLDQMRTAGRSAILSLSTD